MDAHFDQIRLPKPRIDHKEHEKTLDQLMRKFRTFIVQLDEDKKRLQEHIKKDFPIPCETNIHQSTTLPIRSNGKTYNRHNSNHNNNNHHHPSNYHHHHQNNDGHHQNNIHNHNENHHVSIDSDDEIIDNLNDNYGQSLTNHRCTCGAAAQASSASNATTDESLYFTTKSKTTNSNSRLSSATTQTTSKADKSSKTWSYKLFPYNSPSPVNTSNKSTTPPVEISSPYNCTSNFHLIYNTGKMASVAGRGCFIVIEGLDRVGKSTLALKLVDKLSKQSFKVEYLKFPDRTTPIGQLINSYLKNNHDELDDRAVHLLYSANRWEQDKYIRKKIMNGTHIIVDRYIYSGIAYSVAKKGMKLSWCRACEIGLPKPDVVLYLEATREEQASRPGFGQERFEKSDFQDKIRKTYESLIAMNKERWIKFDVNNKEPDELLVEVMTPVKNVMESAARKELGSIGP